VPNQNTFAQGKRIEIGATIEKGTRLPNAAAPAVGRSLLLGGCIR
jgi:hypothetical protein